MAVLETQMLGATVGAEVARRRSRAPDRRRRPARCGARRARGQRRARVPRPAPRRRGPGGVQQAARAGRDVRQRRAPGDLPGHARPGRRTPRPPYLRGTFDWHIDGCTDDIPIMATILSAHAVADSGGETEFASSYAAYDALDRRREGARDDAAGGAHLRGLAAAGQQRPDARGAGDVALAARPRSTRWCGRHARGRRSLVLGATAVARRRAWTPTRAGRSSTTCSTAPPPPSACYRHEWAVGDLVIWDNRGVLHRAVPLRPDVAPRHAPHHPRTATSRSSDGPRRAGGRAAHPAAATGRVAAGDAPRHRRAATRRLATRSRRATKSGPRASTSWAPWPTTRRWPPAFHTFNGHILFGTTLSPRQRELLVLRVAAVRGSAYEWAQHVVLAGDVGISPTRSSASPRGPTRRAGRRSRRRWSRPWTSWSPTRIGDGTWAVLAAELDEQQLMDLVFTVGAYDAAGHGLRARSASSWTTICGE